MLALKKFLSDYSVVSLPNSLFRWFYLSLLYMRAKRTYNIDNKDYFQLAVQDYFTR